MMHYGGQVSQDPQAVPGPTLDRPLENLPGMLISDHIGIKFSLPPTPNVEYHLDNSGLADILDLAFVLQKINETVWQFWMQFLFVKRKSHIAMMRRP